MPTLREVIGNPVLPEDPPPSPFAEILNTESLDRDPNTFTGEFVLFNLQWQASVTLDVQNQTATIEIASALTANTLDIWLTGNLHWSDGNLTFTNLEGELAIQLDGAALRGQFVIGVDGTPEITNVEFNVLRSPALGAAAEATLAELAAFDPPILDLRDSFVLRLPENGWTLPLPDWLPAGARQLTVTGTIGIDGVNLAARTNQDDVAVIARWDRVFDKGNWFEPTELTLSVQLGDLLRMVGLGALAPANDNGDNGMEGRIVYRDGGWSVELARRTPGDLFEVAPDNLQNLFGFPPAPNGVLRDLSIAVRRLDIDFQPDNNFAALLLDLGVTFSINGLVEQTTIAIRGIRGTTTLGAAPNCQIDASCAHFEIERPGKWKLPGALNNLPVRVREVAMLRGTRLGLRARLGTGLDLGVIELDDIQLEVYFDDLDNPQLGGLGLTLDVGIVRGTGSLTINHDNLQGAVALEISSLDLQVGGSLTIERDNDAAMTAVTAVAKWPTGIPLASTGLGLFGVNGSFVSGGVRNIRAGNDVVAQELAWWARQDKFKVGPKGSWGLGIGSSVGLLADGGWSFSATGMIFIGAPEGVFIMGADASLLERRNNERATRPPGGAALKGLLTFSEAGFNTVVIGNFHLAHIVTIEVPVAAGFSAAPARGFVYIGDDGNEDEGRSLGPVRLGVNLGGILQAEAYAFVMIDSAGIPAFAPGYFENPTDLVPGPAIGFGAGFHVGIHVGPFGAELWAKTAFGIQPDPFIVVGTIGVGGSIDLLVASVGASARLNIIATEDNTRVWGEVCGKIRLLFFTIKGCLPFGNEPPPPALEPPDPLAGLNIQRQGQPSTTITPEGQNQNHEIWPDTELTLEFANPVSFLAGVVEGGQTKEDWYGNRDDGASFSHQVTKISLARGDQKIPLDPFILDSPDQVTKVRLQPGPPQSSDSPEDWSNLCNEPPDLHRWCTSLDTFSRDGTRCNVRGGDGFRVYWSDSPELDFDWTDPTIAVEHSYIEGADTNANTPPTFWFSGEGNVVPNPNGTIRVGYLFGATQLNFSEPLVDVGVRLRSTENVGVEAQFSYAEGETDYGSNQARDGQYWLFSTPGPVTGIRLVWAGDPGRIGLVSVCGVRASDKARAEALARRKKRARRVVTGQTDGHPMLIPGDYQLQVAWTSRQKWKGKEVATHNRTSTFRLKVARKTENAQWGRGFHPRLLNRDLVATSPDPDERFHFLDDPIELHWTSDQIADLLHVYKSELDVKVHTTNGNEIPPRSEPDWIPPRSVDLIGLLAKLSYLLPFSRGGCIRDDVPTGFASQSINFELKPNTTYRASIGWIPKRKGGRHNAFRSVPFRTSRYRNPTELYDAALGEVHVVRVARLPQAAEAASDAAMAAFLSEAALDGELPVPGTLLITDAEHPTIIRALLVMSDEPLLRPNRIGSSTDKVRAIFDDNDIGEVLLSDEIGTRLLWTVDPEPMPRQIELVVPEIEWSQDNSSSVLKRSSQLVTPSPVVRATLPPEAQP